MALSVEARPQSIAAWRGDLLAPDPVRASWLTRTTDRRKDRKKEKEEAEAAPAIAATVPITPPTAMPPPPDAPGPKGGLLDFLEGLRKKPAGERPLRQPAPCAGADPNRSALRRRLLLPRPSKLDAPPAPVLQEEVAVEEAHSARNAPSSSSSRRRVRGRAASKGSRPSLMPIVFKLLVGVGVASAAVAMQDRFPQFESRGSAVTTGITTGTTNPLPPQAQAARSRPGARHPHRRDRGASRLDLRRSPTPTTAAASSPPATTDR